MTPTEIKSLRERMGMTQEDFAHRIGVTYASISRWENGASKPSRLAQRLLTMNLLSLGGLDDKISRA